MWGNYGNGNAHMTCPDENLVSRILSGSASSSERAEFHRHVDQCPECLQLIEVLGEAEDFQFERRIRAGTGDSFRLDVGYDQSATAGARQVDRATALLAMALAEAACALILLPSCRQFSEQRLNSALDVAQILMFAWVSYLEVHLVVGPIVGIAALYGAFKHRRWSAPAQRLCAWTALFTLFLTPLAACNLWRARGND